MPTRQPSLFPEFARMTAYELNIGDVFRIVGETKLWRKTGPTTARLVGVPRARWGDSSPLSSFTAKGIEVVERASTAEIRREGSTLVLRNGEVTLEYHGPWGVHSCTPGEPHTQFVLTAGTFGDSTLAAPTADAALAFVVGAGAKELGRSRGSEIFAYQGRVYARATKVEVLGGGRHSAGGYKRIKKIDGKSRIIIAGLLTIPGEFALYDIMVEHFGPDTVAPPIEAPSET